MKKRIYFLSLSCFVLLYSLQVQAQAYRKTALRFPDVKGYHVLLGDFHVHTIFSDGSLHPIHRVEEGYESGLDVMALTDHIEDRNRYRDDIAHTNKNREYEVAEKMAKSLNMILIRGAELTKERPLGHINVLFLKDANALVPFQNPEKQKAEDRIEELLTEVKHQGGLAIFNHPWGSGPEGSKGDQFWSPIHESLYQKGLIQGIEVASGKPVEPKLITLAENKKLTVFGNQDLHPSLESKLKQYNHAHRNLTLLFVKERSEVGVKEAILDDRTVAVRNNQLFGKRKNLVPLMESVLTFKAVATGGKEVFVEMVNQSGMPYDMRQRNKQGGKTQGELFIDAHAKLGLILKFPKAVKAGDKIQMDLTVLNAFTGEGQSLIYPVELTIE